MARRAPIPAPSTSRVWPEVDAVARPAAKPPTNNPSAPATSAMLNDALRTARCASFYSVGSSIGAPPALSGETGRSGGNRMETPGGSCVRTDRTHDPDHAGRGSRRNRDADLRIRMSRVRSPPRGRPELHREAAHEVPELQGRPEEGVLACGHRAEGLRVLPYRQPPGRRREQVR